MRVARGNRKTKASLHFTLCALASVSPAAPGVDTAPAARGRDLREEVFGDVKSHCPLLGACTGSDDAVQVREVVERGWPQLLENLFLPGMSRVEMSTCRGFRETQAASCKLP